MAPVAIPQKHSAGLAALLVLVLASPSEAAQLTAADFDDNLNFSYYLDYAGSPFSGANALGMPNLSLADRVTIRLTDREDHPVSNAVVELTPQPQQGDVIRLIAGPDGVVRFFPSFDGDGDATSFTMDIMWPGEERATVSASLNLATLNEARDYTVKVQNRTASLPNAMDLMFLIDTTGSMSDEISYLRSEFANITGAIDASHPNLDTRFGLVVYRDEGDDYVVKSYGFTADGEQMKEWLHEIRAEDGGDMPEAMDAGLKAAVAQGWRAGNTARVLFLVADAPSHAAGYAPFILAAGEARRAGVHIFPVAASGVERYAQYLMRAAEVLTQGRYIFLTDDSGIGNPHATPLVPCYVVTPLAGLMTRVVGGELLGARIEPPADAILRTVGNYSAGRCVEQGQVERPAGGTAEGTQTEPSDPAAEEPATEPKVTSEPSSGPVMSEESYSSDPSTDTARSTSDSGTVWVTSSVFGETSTTTMDGPGPGTVSPTLSTESGEAMAPAAPPADPLPSGASSGWAISLVLGFVAVAGAVGAALVGQGLRHRVRR